MSPEDEAVRRQVEALVREMQDAQMRGNMRHAEDVRVAIEMIMDQYEGRKVKKMAVIDDVGDPFGKMTSEQQRKFFEDLVAFDEKRMRFGKPKERPKADPAFFWDEPRPEKQDNTTRVIGVRCCECGWSRPPKLDIRTRRPLMTKCQCGHMQCKDCEILTGLERDIIARPFPPPQSWRSKHSPDDVEDARRRRAIVESTDRVQSGLRAQLLSI